MTARDVSGEAGRPVRALRPCPETPARANAVTWDGRQFVVVGEDRSDYDGTNLPTAMARAAVWTSPDGRTWTRVPHAPVFDVGNFSDTMDDPSSGGMADVMAGEDGLVAVGSAYRPTADGCQPVIWTSGDGTAWERVADLQTPRMPPRTGTSRPRRMPRSGSGRRRRPPIRRPG